MSRVPRVLIEQERLRGAISNLCAEDLAAAEAEIAASPPLTAGQQNALAVLFGMQPVDLRSGTAAST